VRQDTKEVLPNVLVSIRELNLWSYTDEKGFFKFETLQRGVYHFDIYSLGYAELTLLVDVKEDIGNLQIEMKEENLKIEGVIVTDRDGKDVLIHRL